MIDVAKQKLMNDPTFKHLSEDCQEYYFDFGSRTGYLRKDQPMILTVVSNRELMRLNQIVQETDPQAFMIIGNVNEVRGRGFSTQKVYKNEVGMNE